MSGTSFRCNRWYLHCICTHVTILVHRIQVPRVTNINFLLTISIHHQKKWLWELTKWSTKEKCVDLYKAMYGHLNCGEFVFGYWGLRVNALIRALSLNGIQQIKMKSIRKLSNFNFQWTKILYQKISSHIASFFALFKGCRCNY